MTTLGTCQLQGMIQTGFFVNSEQMHNHKTAVIFFMKFNLHTKVSTSSIHCITCDTCMTPLNAFEKTPGILTSIDGLRNHVIRNTQK